ncbi:hypothetical protein AAHN97_26910 [Chitinophaga niabensis]|uniref:hypothetical protein n=1 Tax=Chitinophaga niabensis TaxID=536979 RepID=UPI0031BB18CE
MHDINKFLSDFLNKGTLNPENRKRFIKLIEIEIKKGVEINADLLGRIDALQSEIGTVEDHNTQHTNEKKSDLVTAEAVKNEKRSLPQYKNPKNLARFLTSLNSNTILKSTTHSIDADLYDELLYRMGIPSYDYETHFKYIKKEYDELLQQYRTALPPAIVAKLNEFYFFEKKTGWSEAHIRIGWFSEEIKTWCRNHPGCCPNPGNDMEYLSPNLFRRERDVDNNVLNNFQDIIDSLKMQIECRDKSYLENALWKLNFDKFRQLNITLDGITKCLQFYTDVEKLKQAYKNIIHMCIEEHNKKNGSLKDLQIEVSLKKEKRTTDDVVILSILHKGSVFGKDITPPFRYGKSLTNLIQNQLNGMCNLELQTVLPDGRSVIFDLWPKGNSIIPLHESMNGVQFNLIFNLD